MKNKYEKNNFIALAVPDIRGDVKKSLFKIIDDNWVSSAGKEINIFEESIAKIAHSKYALATITGSAALHLALKTMDIGPGDKVLVQGVMRLNQL